MEYIHVGPNRVYRIVVKLHDDFDLSKDDEWLNQQLWVDDAGMPGLQLQRLFTTLVPPEIRELTTRAKQRDTTYHPPNFLNYYSLDLYEKTRAERALNTLRSSKVVEQAHLEINPVGLPAVVDHNPSSLYHSGHLDAAPAGIDAAYAWQYKGGDGNSTVKFIDIEQGWINGHEAVPVQTLSCSGLNHAHCRDHGTGVLGLIQMQPKNGAGITPRANGYVLSQWRPDGSLNIPDAILAAIHHLNEGDVLLLQAQAYNAAAQKAMPVEIMEVNFQLIRLATTLGICVIEPAGNGDNRNGHDLDLLTGAGGHCFLNCSSPYYKDSGAIVVAAAGSKAPHQRMAYSNFGSRVDCYAWGENLLTAGSFPLSSGDAINTYTKNFSGTSGASAIITGVVVALQSIAERNFGYRLSPLHLRSLLNHEALGTASAYTTALDKIGVMPDLKKIINHLLKQIEVKKGNAIKKREKMITH